MSASTMAGLVQQAHEVIGLVGQSAHAGGEHAEHMRRIGIAIGDALPCSRAAFDQCRPRPVMTQ